MNFLQKQEAESQFEYVDMNSLGGERAADPIMFKMEIDNEKLCMEIDTGAGVSVISIKDQSERLGKFCVEQTLVTLRTYDKNIIVPVGQVRVPIVLRGKEVQARLIVVRERNRPLFGRDLMKEFGMGITELEVDVNGLSD